VDNVLAFILGGGKGSRLSPLTKCRSKPAVPLGGKYRLVDIPVSNCINSNIIKIYVITQYNSESLNRSVFQTYKFDIFSKGYIQILTAEQTPDNKDWFQGTADAIRKNLKHISDRFVDTIIILSGDQLYRMNYKEIVRQHKASGADATLALTLTEADKAPAFGLAKIDENLEIQAFVEKPQDPAVIRDFCVPASVKADQGLTGGKDVVLANMGIYVFSRQYLVELMESTSECDFGKHIFPGLLGKKKLGAYIHNGYWEDIGTIKAFYEANLALTGPLPQFNLYDMEAPIYAQPLFLPPSKLESCAIDNSLISDGCILNQSVITHSVVGVRSIIKKNAHITEAIIMGADYYEAEGKQNKRIPSIGIGHNCIITGAIIDKNARIGNHVKIINQKNRKHFEGDNYTIKDGVVIIEKNAAIPDKTVI